MRSSSAQNQVHAVLPLLGTSAAFASLIGVVFAFGAAAMAMM